LTAGNLLTRPTGERTSAEPESVSASHR
jgi:hypothetical protein